MAWGEEDERRHPRDDRGRWAEKRGGDWADRVSSQLDGYRPAQDRLDSADYADLRKLVKRFNEFGDHGPQGNPDKALEAIYRLQGFDNKPRVMPAGELDRLVAGGWREVWRGVKGRTAEGSAKFAQQFRHDDGHFGGWGIFGNGTYASNRSETGRQYAGYHPSVDTDPSTSDEDWKKAYEHPANWPGLLRMALRPDARTIAFSDLAALMKADGRLDRYAEPTDDRSEVLRDPGRYAALAGYDAIVADRIGDGQETYYVVLNRAAVAVQEAYSDWNVGP